MEPETPEQLFARYAKLGDPKDLAEVFDRTSPELLRLSMHLVSREADAEDLLQATIEDVEPTEQPLEIEMRPL